MNGFGSAFACRAVCPLVAPARTRVVFKVLPHTLSQESRGLASHNALQKRVREVLERLRLRHGSPWWWRRALVEVHRLVLLQLEPRSEPNSAPEAGVDPVCLHHVVREPVAPVGAAAAQPALELLPAAVEGVRVAAQLVRVGEILPAEDAAGTVVPSLDLVREERVGRREGRRALLTRVGRGVRAVVRGVARVVARGVARGVTTGPAAGVSGRSGCGCCDDVAMGTRRSCSGGCCRRVAMATGCSGSGLSVAMAAGWRDVALCAGCAAGGGGRVAMVTAVMRLHVHPEAGDAAERGVAEAAACRVGVHVTVRHLVPLQLVT